MKVLWLSRHGMTPAQEQDLCEHCHINAEVVTSNITWKATSDYKADLEVNSHIWLDLLHEYKYIAGVFPPVAIESLPHGYVVYTPVSRQAPELRVGDGPIPFQHLRWSTLYSGV